MRIHRQAIRCMKYRKNQQIKRLILEKPAPPAPLTWHCLLLNGLDRLSHIEFTAFISSADPSGSVGERSSPPLFLTVVDLINRHSSVTRSEEPGRMNGICLGRPIRTW